MARDRAANLLHLLGGFARGRRLGHGVRVFLLPRLDHPGGGDFSVIPMPAADGKMAAAGARADGTARRPLAAALALALLLGAGIAGACTRSDTAGLKTPPRQNSGTAQRYPLDSADSRGVPAWSAAEKGGVILAIGVSRRVLKPGQPVTVEVYALNRGATGVRYVVGAVGYPAPTVWVDAGDFGRVELMEPENRDRVWAEAEEVRDLVPGARLVRRLTWDQRISADGHRVQAPPGTYRIRAALAIQGPHGTGADAEVLEASIAVVVLEDGGFPGKNTIRISRKKALELALREPRVDQWLRERRHLPPPATGVTFADGGWRIALGQKLGPPPRAVLVIVDHLTGAVREVRFCATSCP